MTDLLRHRFDFVALTTLARVKAKMDNSLTVPAQDAVLQAHIDEVSAEFASYLQFHTLRKDRDEVHRIRAASADVTLGARPVHALSQVVWAEQLEGLEEATPLGLDCYLIHPETGWLELDLGTAGGRGYVRVSYNGGLGTMPEALPGASPTSPGAMTPYVVIEFPEIAAACEAQVAYRHQRQSTLGGDVTTIPGAGTSFRGEYGLLKSVEAVLNRYRRMSI